MDWREIERYAQEAASRYSVAAELHRKDFLLDYVVGVYKDHPGGLGTALTRYFDRGQDNVEILKRVIAKAIPIKKTANFLEFASGYGMTTRHLVKEVNWRISSCDIHEEAMPLLASMGATPLLSKTNPDDVKFDEVYDIVFAISFFTHMPRRTWERWLEKLWYALAPGGALIFTTHGVTASARNSSIVLSDGFGFKPASEQKDLDVSDYGTTIALPSFVAKAIERTLSTSIQYFERDCFFSGFQDAYVVIR